MIRGKYQIVLREKSLIIGIGWNGGCTKCKRGGGGGGGLVILKGVVRTTSFEVI